MAKTATIEDLFKKKPITQTVSLVLDSNIADEWEQVKAEYDNAKRQAQTWDNPVTQAAFKEAESAYKKLKPKMESAVVELTVQALGRKAYEELTRAHPATDKQIEEAREQNPNASVMFNYDTFPKALFAASLVKPKLTAEQVDQLFESDNYNQVELGRLTGAALEVNQTSKVADLGKE
jgi:hypothetical protein